MTSVTQIKDTLVVGTVGHDVTCGVANAEAFYGRQHLGPRITHRVSDVRILVAIALTRGGAE